MSTPVSFLGIHGRAGVGKDSAASLLRSALGYEVLAFADPLKAMLNEGFGWTYEQWLDRDWKERVQPDIETSPRRAAQTLGTDWARRMIHPDIWVRLADRRVKRLKALSSFDELGPPPICFTDVRFDNEAKWVREMGGRVLMIHRQASPTVAAHSSEAGIDPRLITDHVSNNGTLAELSDKLVAIATGTAFAPAKEA